MQPFRLPSSALLALALAVPATASAQIALNVQGEVAIKSAYVDRGIILANMPVLQPSLTIGSAVGGGTAALQLWANVEVVRADDVKYFGLAGAAAGKLPNVSEFRPALRLSQPFLHHYMDFEFEAAYRMFPNDSLGVHSNANTGVITSRVGFPRLPFAPAAAFVYEIGAITGPSVEVEVRQGVTVTPGVSLYAGSNAGWTIAHTLNHAPPEFDAYDERGFSHVEATVGGVFRAAGARVNPFVSIVYTNDPAPPDLVVRHRSHYVYFGTSISLSGTFPKPKPGAAKPGAPAKH